MFDLEDETIWNGLLKDNHIVLAEFFQQGNPQSAKLMKILEPKFLKQIGDYNDTTFVRIDMKKYPNLVKTYNIAEIPTIMIFHHEKPVKLLPKDPKINVKKNFQLTGIHEDIAKYLSDLMAELHKPAKK